MFKNVGPDLVLSGRTCRANLSVLFCPVRNFLCPVRLSSTSSGGRVNWSTNVWGKMPPCPPLWQPWAPSHPRVQVDSFCSQNNTHSKFRDNNRVKWWWMIFRQPPQKNISAGASISCDETWKIYTGPPRESSSLDFAKWTLWMFINCWSFFLGLHYILFKGGIGLDVFTYMYMMKIVLSADFKGAMKKKLWHGLRIEPQITALKPQTHKPK